jgi:hypothetical protein
VADASFTITFKPPPPTPTHSESGVWGVKGKVYITRTTEVDGVATDEDDPDSYDEYELESVRPEEIRYRHIKLKIRFRSTRVSETFTVP